MPRINVSISQDLKDAIDAVTLSASVSSICQSALEDAVARARGTADVTLTVPADLARDLEQVSTSQPELCAHVLQTALRTLLHRPPGSVADVITDPGKASLVDQLRVTHEVCRWTHEQMRPIQDAVEKEQWDEARKLVERLVTTISAPFDTMDVAEASLPADFLVELSRWVALTPGFGAVDFDILLGVFEYGMEEGRKCLALALKRADEGRWVDRGSSSFAMKVDQAAQEFSATLGGKSVRDWEDLLELGELSRDRRAGRAGGTAGRWPVGIEA